MAWADNYPVQQLVPYDCRWVTSYREFEGILKNHLGPGWEFEHVGSTSVPGLLAKPVIDVAMGMPEGVEAGEASVRLRQAGWSAPVPVGDHWATVFPAHGRRAAIGHMFRAAQWPEAHVRLFASWLRAHDIDREAYSVLKRDLVTRGVWSDAYTRSKGEFVLHIVNQARAEFGLKAMPGPL